MKRTLITVVLTLLALRLLNAVMRSKAAGAEVAFHTTPEGGLEAQVGEITLPKAYLAFVMFVDGHPLGDILRLYKE